MEGKDDKGYFAVGNQFWKQRSKHGRDKLFASPDLLWEAASEYFEATDKRKWIKKDWVGKDANEVERECDTPYTLSGMCLYFDCSRQWWNEFKDAKHSDFFEVIARIENIMNTQKFEGAAVGAFNANIISRDLGLIDRQDIDHKTNGKDLPASTFKVEIVKPDDIED
jgi:hypothetical protein